MSGSHKVELPPKSDTDGYSQEEARRLIAEERSRRLAKMVAEEMVKLQKESPHVCALPPTLVVWLAEPATEKMLKDLSQAYVESRETRHYIKNVAIGSITALVIGLLLLGIKEWFGGKPLPPIPGP